MIPVVDQNQAEILYPLHRISLDKLNYRWEHPSFGPRTEARYCGWYRDMEVLLRTDPDHPSFEGTQRGREIRLLFKHLLWIKTVRNYLLVKQLNYDPPDTSQYFVVVGNMRLSCLRAMTQEQQVQVLDPDRNVTCVVALANDDWKDGSEAIRIRPYIPDPMIGWKNVN